jgi:hypothetical protein
MAPSYYCNTATQVTQISSTLTYSSADDSYYYSYCQPVQQPQETKKERVKRVAAEKMHASWKLHNQKTEKILVVKQICKPRHNIYNFKKR